MIRIFFQVFFAKVFLILGLPWVCESIHYFLFSKATQNVANVNPTSCKNDALEIAFRVVSGFNLLRGFFLLLIFGCKKVMWQRIKKRLGIKSDVQRRKGVPTATTSRMTDVDEHWNSNINSYQQTYLLVICMAKDFSEFVQRKVF